MATTTVSVLAGAFGATDGVMSSEAAIPATIAAVVLNSLVFAVVFRIATATRLRVRDVLPGAVLSAVVWQLMQVFGTAYTAGVVKDSTPTYGVFALVLGLLGWTFLVALGVVFGVELNVVRTKRLFPRALLTPFTDDVDLTSADVRAYGDAARAQRHKGFQDVAVTFEHGGQNASASRIACRRRRRRPSMGRPTIRPAPDPMDRQRRDQPAVSLPPRRARAAAAIRPMSSAGTPVR